MDEATRKNKTQYDLHATEWQAAMQSNLGHKYLERPAMKKELPQSLKEKSVLCIGVGSGEELKEIVDLTPRHITAIDISEKLLKIARSRFPEVEFREMDMMQLDFPAESFDFVYSSLTFHYANDWDLLLKNIYHILRKDGVLLFSTHHPEYWSYKSPTGNSFKNDRGVILSQHVALLPGNVHITFYNHPNLESIKEAVRHAGFSIQTSFVPSVVDLPLDSIPPKDVRAYLKLKNKKMPLFFIIRATK